MPPPTAIFTRLVREHMRAAPPAVPEGTPCGEALARLAAAGASALVVTDGEGRIAGIVTEQDVARRIAFRLDRAAPIERAMTAPVATIADDDYVYHAIAAMRRRGLRHLPVVDSAGRATGMIELHTALGLAAPEMVDRIDRLTHAHTVEGLAAVKGEQVAVAEQLFADHVPAPDILALISQVNADLHRRVLEMSLREMGAEPPLAFALLVMGSGGRGESVIGADQDNGFVLADYDDAAHDSIDRYFADLGERMCATLDRIGLPLCRGGVMASNPLWRKSLGQWRAQIDFWLRRRSRAIVRLADVFVDFRPVWGELALGRALRVYVGERMPGAFAFLQAMHAEQMEHATALGWFGRLRTHGEKEHRHLLNLKYDAGLPLVETIRLLSLANGVPETGTPARIDALAEKGVLGSDERDYLGAAFDIVTALTLRRQIADFRAGSELGYWLDPATLAARERELLVDGLRAIEALRDRVKSDFTGKVF